MLRPELLRRALAGSRLRRGAVWRCHFRVGGEALAPRSGAGCLSPAAPRGALSARLPLAHPLARKLEIPRHGCSRASFALSQTHTVCGPWRSYVCGSCAVRVANDPTAHPRPCARNVRDCQPWRGKLSIDDYPGGPESSPGWKSGRLDLNQRPLGPPWESRGQVASRYVTLRDSD